jgi:hypothetical protein
MDGLVKEAIEPSHPNSARRMVKEYVEKMYAGPGTESRHAIMRCRIAGWQDCRKERSEGLPAFPFCNPASCNSARSLTEMI